MRREPPGEPRSTSIYRQEGRLGGGGMVLLVDEDSDFRSALATNLREDGLEVREFASARDIPEVMPRPTQPMVLITDYQLEGGDGLSLADRFRRRHPAAGVLLVTAHWTEHLEAAAALREFVTLLRKPVDYDELYRHLDRFIGGSHS